MTEEPLSKNTSNEVDKNDTKQADQPAENGGKSGEKPIICENLSLL